MFLCVLFLHVLSPPFSGKTIAIGKVLKLAEKRQATGK